MKVTRGNFKIAAENAETAILNEMTTRERVDNLEKWAFTMGRLWGGRGFWGRLSWLFLGR